VSVAEERRRRAIAAASAVARKHGLEPRDPVVLQDWNNTVVHLRPLPLVAKVSTSPLGHLSRSFQREVDATTYLADRKGPVIPPSSLLPPSPHHYAGMLVTFWEYCAGARVDESDAVEVGSSLAVLHSEFSGYVGELPSFREQVEDVSDLLARHGALPALGSADHSFLRDRADRLVERLNGFDLEEQPLHSEAHLGNVMRTEEGLRWFDFESVCRGPREWDLSTLPGDALHAFEDYDAGLLDLLRQLRSLCVAAWCWVQPERAPEVAEAARFHLRLLKDAR
jgi:Ser/Thr protein kinase RdoA (MazF antagonist)